MHINNMTVPQRIAAIKDIFKDFGIPVPIHSQLEHAIITEFGRGKRSKLTEILASLGQNTEAAELSVCISAALAQHTDEPQIVELANIMRERLPSLLHIIDIRQQTTRRIELLDRFLLHFEAKLTDNERLSRMLASSRKLLRDNMQLRAMGNVIEKTGTVVEVQQITDCGRILQYITPALIALDQSQVTSEQKINLCVQALAAVSRELNDTNLAKAARVIDSVHLLANITLPEVPEQATVEQALQTLNLSLGTITTLNLQKKAKAAGLTDKELIQVLYANHKTTVLTNQDQELLSATKENKQYAATCGLLANLGKDLNCKDLEQVAIAGVCLISMRQTYYELKTNNLNAANFSESLGLILSNVGVLTNNKTLAKIGTSILDGVKVYAGVMAVPGGAVVAVPLAICAVLSKLLLNRKSKSSANQNADSNVMMRQMLGQIISMQTEMRAQFSHLYEMLRDQHQSLLIALDQGFSNLSNCLQYHAVQNIAIFRALDRKLDAFHVDISTKLSDLYLEYVHEPVEEIQFLDDYEQTDIIRLQNNKMKLSMWLLYKSKNPKVNGRDLISGQETQERLSIYVAMILSKINDYDSILGMINRYVNLEFNQQLSEELPHVPTWIIAAEKYAYLLNNYSHELDLRATEPQVLTDIIATGEQVLHFVQQLAADNAVLSTIISALQQRRAAMQTCITHVLYHTRSDCLQSLLQLRAAAIEISQIQDMMASSASMAEQLENFEPLGIDISYVWQEYLCAHVPVEFLMAADYGLGDLECRFAIDKDSNDFINIRVPYSHNPLPNHARDVLYRIEVYFKPSLNAPARLLLRAWFAYDLCSAAKMLDEYYRCKFVNPLRLRHSRYHEIGPNGSHQVAWYNVVNDNKPENLTKLANIYKAWWSRVLPVSSPDVLARVKEQPNFYAKHKIMLDQGRCVQIEPRNIRVLQSQLQAQLHTAILRRRINLASALQNARAIQPILDKIDAYTAVLTVFQQMLHIPVTATAVSLKFQGILAAMSQAETLDCDLQTQVNDLFISDAMLSVSPTNYRQGVFYQKLDYTLSQLRLLANTLPTHSLRL